MRTKVAGLGFAEGAEKREERSEKKSQIFSVQREPVLDSSVQNFLCVQLIVRS